jgi:hypothetical protein
VAKDMHATIEEITGEIDLKLGCLHPVAYITG